MRMETPEQLRTHPFGGETSEADRAGALVLKRLAPAADVPPPRIGRFAVLSELGQGGMGIVYSVYDEELDRRVALKLLRRAPHRDQTAERARLRREALAMAKLKHPNIVPLFEVGEHNGQPFIVMEQVDGQTLRAWVKAEPREVSAVLAKFVQAGRGLAAAHGVGLVHRDFKPDNAIVGEGGRVQVLDFGLARRPSDAVEPVESTAVASDAPIRTLTPSAEIAGTPGYMAPEQFAGEAVGPQSDQFAFCVALYEALVGERPFAGLSRAELASEVTAGRIRPLPARVTVPAWLLKIIRRGLSPRAEDRFGSMQALLRAMTRRRRRTRTVAVAGLVVAAAVAFMLLPIRGGADLECARATDSIREAWTPAEEAKLKAALVATGHRDAAPVWSATREPIDRFVTDWAAQYDHLCGSWRNAVAPDVLSLRRDCLNVQRRHFDTVMAALANPTVETVKFAKAAALALPAPPDCAGINSSAGAVPPQWADRVHAAEQSLAQAQALIDAGDPQGVDAFIDTAIEALNGVEAPRSQARAFTLRAHHLYVEGRIEDADAAEQGAQTFRAQTRDLDFIAEGWLERVRNLRVYRPKQLDRQEHLIEAAALAVEAAGNAPKHAAELSFVKGMVAFGRSRFDGARDSFEGALALADEGDLPPDRIAEYHARLGDVHLSMARYDAAVNSARRAVKISRDAYGRAHPSVAQYLGNAGTKCILMGDLSCARRYFEEAKEVIDAAGHGATGARVDNLGNLALLERMEGHGAAARGFAEEGLAVLRKLGLDHTADAVPLLESLYQVEHNGGNHEASLTIARELDRIATESFPEGHPRSVTGAEALAHAHQSAGRFDEALAANLRQLEVYRAALGEDHRYTADAWSRRGLILEAKGDLERAVDCLRRAHAIYSDLPPQPIRSVRAFLYARLRWEVEGPSAATLRLVLDAREEFEAAGPTWAEELEQVNAWIGEHGGLIPAG